MKFSRIPKWFIVAALFLVLAGFFDAAFLTVKHYTEGTIPCPVFGSCEEVTNSKYGSLLGLPVSLYGAAYYLSILIALIAYWDTKKKFFIAWAIWLPFFGLAFSAWMMYAQYFLIKAFCFWCVVSATISLILAILSVRIIQLNRS